jgi:hypothetical protein
MLKVTMLCVTALSALVMASCDRPEQDLNETNVGKLQTGAVAAKNIGDPCVASDGWSFKPPMPPSAKIDGSGPPTAYAIPPGLVDRHQLGPATGYCLTGGLYPQGYYTMNCQADAQCPNGYCDGELCRRGCTADSECATGTSCKGLGRRFCQGQTPGRQDRVPQR